jgi:hypothetical protein
VIERAIEVRLGRLAKFHVLSLWHCITTANKPRIRNVPSQVKTTVVKSRVKLYTSSADLMGYDCEKFVTIWHVQKKCNSVKFEFAQPLDFDINKKRTCSCIL